MDGEAAVMVFEGKSETIFSMETMEPIEPMGTWTDFPRGGRIARMKTQIHFATDHRGDGAAVTEISGFGFALAALADVLLCPVWVLGFPQRVRTIARVSAVGGIRWMVGGSLLAVGGDESGCSSDGGGDEEIGKRNFQSESGRIKLDQTFQIFAVLGKDTKGQKGQKGRGPRMDLKGN
jgi:hypothetical protein